MNGLYVFKEEYKLIAKLEAGFTAKDAKTKGIDFAGSKSSL